MEIPKIPQLPTKQNQEIAWLTSPDKFLAEIKPKTALDVVNSPNKSLAVMVKDFGVLKVRALLTLLIAETVDYYSVGKTMGAPQLAQTIDLIIEDYGLEKPDYFKLCFNRAKKGWYGKSYDRVDGDVIFGWLAQFDYEYALEIENERRNESIRMQKDNAIPEITDPKNAPVPMPEYIKEAYRNIGKKEATEKRPIERTKEQKIMDRLIQDFNDLYGVKMESGGRFVEVYSIIGDPDAKPPVPNKTRKMDINEYLEFRMINKF